MKTITLTAAEARLVQDALQVHKNKLTREAGYIGQGLRRKEKMIDTAINCKQLQHKIINSK